MEEMCEEPTVYVKECKEVEVEVKSVACGERYLHGYERGGSTGAGVDLRRTVRPVLACYPLSQCLENIISKPTRGRCVRINRRRYLLQSQVQMGGTGNTSSSRRHQSRRSYRGNTSDRGVEG